MLSKLKNVSKIKKGIINIKAGRARLRRKKVTGFFLKGSPI